MSDRTPNNTLPAVRPYVYRAVNPDVPLPPAGSAIMIRLPSSTSGPASVVSNSAI
ncbi:hypothetical protein K440DRAFT_629468 [Wilcoxina mikolae CBS 423.85]|nr:hypothetical protein K440DRAFT_629468 [Wilcoxina mikolae CBS 423.85]